jgi:hypothetical protein
MAAVMACPTRKGVRAILGKHWVWHGPMVIRFLRIGPQSFSNSYWDWRGPASCFRSVSTARETVLTSFQHPPEDRQNRIVTPP